MTYDLQTVVPSVTSQLAVSSNYLVSWSAASDATAYELQERAPVIATTFSDSAESLSAPSPTV